MSNSGFVHGLWVLICDGRKALLAENAGDPAAAHLKVRQTFEHPDLATREQGTDKPGRFFSGTGERRSATEPTDFHSLGEEGFLKMLADHLERAVADGRIDKLVLAAPPQALGVLRGALAPAVRKIVRHEVEKDYVNVPIYEVERLLASALAHGGAARNALRQAQGEENGNAHETGDTRAVKFFLMLSLSKHAACLSRIGAIRCITARRSCVQSTMKNAEPRYRS
ncbi:MAG TPA: host attachment protein [Rhizomicrobium sp.]|jgi:protein required for attachment to host cells